MLNSCGFVLIIDFIAFSRAHSRFRLYYHKKAVGKLRKGSKLFADSFAKRCSSGKGKRHVRSKLCAKGAKLFFGKTGFIKRVKSIKRRRGVRASAGHTRLHGYALFYVYFRAAVYAGLLKKQLCCFVCKVTFSVKLAYAAFYGNAVAFCYAYEIKNINALHNGFYEMIAVAAFACYVKKKVKLCAGFKKDSLQNYPSFSSERNSSMRLRASIR